MKYLVLALCLTLAGCDDDDATCPTRALSSTTTTITHHEPTPESTVVPEPATYALVLFGILLLAYRKATA